MIVNMVVGDIFESPYKHIAFGINTEGYNDSGFAEVVGDRTAWKELASTGSKPLGAVLVKQVEGRTFYGIVCHSLKENGWEKTPKVLEDALNESVKIPADETLAIVLVGGGPIGAMSGADPFANMGAMARSKRRVAVYTL